MTDVERLESCPDLGCKPLARNDLSCYGKNGAQRACVLADACRLVKFKGNNAWAGPANLIAERAAQLKEELESLKNGS